MQMWQRAEQYIVRYDDDDDWRRRQRRVTALLDEFRRARYEHPRIMGAAQRELGACIAPMKDRDRG